MGFDYWDGLIAPIVNTTHSGSTPSVSKSIIPCVAINLSYSLRPIALSINKI